MKTNSFCVHLCCDCYDELVTRYISQILQHRRPSAVYQ